MRTRARAKRVRCRHGGAPSARRASALDYHAHCAAPRDASYVLESDVFVCGVDKFKLRVRPRSGPRSLFLGLFLVRLDPPNAPFKRSRGDRYNLHRVELCIADPTRTRGLSSCKRTWSPAVLKAGILGTERMLKHDRWLLSPDHFTADGYMTVSCYVISDAARAAANKPTLSRDLRIFGDACESSYDVSLNCHDGQVLAFKTVLAARCPEFFGVMLYELTAADNNRVVVTVPAIVNAPTVQLFVDYTVSDDSISYAGLTTPQLTQLFLLADMWNFGTLKDACQYVLMSRMDAATCCTLLVTSETHHCAALKDYAMSYFRANAGAALAHPEALSLLTDYPHLLKEVMIFFAQASNARQAPQAPVEDDDAIDTGGWSSSGDDGD
jgi:hypothetical protein